jgi:hypothetical protein
MADITPTSSTPKDMKQRMGAVKGINPDDPNDAAFELVTMFVFFFVLPQLTLFFKNTSTTTPPPRIPASPFRTPSSSSPSLFPIRGWYQ